MKGDSCISYEWLRKWIDDLMIKKGVRHLLVILDACQAGLGLYSKSDTYAPLEVLLKYPSAHMMTAGLMEQNAQVDTQTGVSVFTQILYEGLEGKADLTDDNIITLSELLVYVQKNVSKYVKEKWNVEQVPSMGIIRGPGEMLFFVKRSSGH
jgi:glycosylphosphatidylinositol transamidase (GPIT) subunit GPI8